MIMFFSLPSTGKVVFRMECLSRGSQELHVTTGDEVGYGGVH